MTRRVLAVLAFVVLLCAFSSLAAAQSNPCQATQSWWQTPNSPIPLGWYFLNFYPGTYAILIGAQKATCPPADAAPETRACPTCATAGHPISLATGNTFIEQTDVKIPGLSGGLTLVRRWNSMWPATQSTLQIGMFGPNWRSNFEERVFVGSDNYIKYARGDGSFWSFGYNNNGNWAVAAPANVAATLTQGSTNWQLTFLNGEQRLFNINTGKLVSIIDRNGNTTQMTYDSLGRLSTVTDPVSRHLYFGYGSGSGALVTSVTSDFGISLSYAYDTQGRMYQFTKPDLTTISFQFDSNSLISAVLDSNNKILESHTYDSSGRGLTSSRANGVDAVTISYQ